MSRPDLFSTQWSIKTNSGMKYCIAEIGKVQSGAQLTMPTFQKTKD